MTHAVEKITIKADDDDPSAQLMAAWLHTRLGVSPEIVDTQVERNSEHLPAIASVAFTMDGGETMEVERKADGTTVLRQAGLPKRRQTLQGRTLGQLLAEELRHIDPDTAYRKVLATFQEHYRRAGERMSRSGAVIVHNDAEVLAEAVASRLLNRLADAQAHRGEASIVLTGGRIAAKVYQNILGSPIRTVVNWSKVDFWWGDERFLPSGDPERNETQAREAFLDHLPVDPARVHPMAAADAVETPEDAALRCTARSWRKPRAAKAFRRSTCCSWASARTAMSRRCSRGTRRSDVTRVRRWGSATPPSRRRSGSR